MTAVVRTTVVTHPEASSHPSDTTGYSPGDPFMTKNGTLYLVSDDGTTWVAAAGGGSGFADLQLLLPGAVVVGTDVAPPGLYVGRASTITAVHLGLGTAPTGGAMSVTLHYTSGGAAATQVVSCASGVATGSVTGLTLAVDAGTYIIIEVTSANGASDLNVALLGTLV